MSLIVNSSKHKEGDLGEMKIDKFLDIFKKEISDSLPEFNIN